MLGERHASVALVLPAVGFVATACGLGVVNVMVPPPLVSSAPPRTPLAPLHPLRTPFAPPRTPTPLQVALLARAVAPEAIGTLTGLTRCLFTLGYCTLPAPLVPLLQAAGPMLGLADGRYRCMLAPSRTASHGASRLLPT